MKSKILILLIFSSFLFGCKDAELQTSEFPLLVTQPISEVNTTGATFQASIVVNGKEDITDYGFIWSDGATEMKISLLNKSSLKDFKIRIKSDLILNTNYWCKAYITTTHHLVYGNKVKFTSLGSSLPQIVDFNLKEGLTGDTVHLTGHYFSVLNKNNKVFVNNVPATIILSNDSIIDFIVPMQSFIGKAEVAVEVNSVRVIAPSKFNILGPQISSISSLAEFSGSQITLNGKNFIRSGSNLSVLFGNYTAEIVSASSTKIVVTVPIAKNNLLGVNNVTIKLIIGQESTTYGSLFLIKNSWQKKNPPISIVSFSTAYENGFTYKGKGYLLYTNDGTLKEYNSLTDSWTQYGVSAFPGAIYNSSLFIQSNDNVFRVGGVNYMYSPINDLWSYNFTNNTWTKKTNLPFSFSSASFFNLDNQLYVLTLGGQLWQCDFENELYKRLNDFPAQFADYFVSTFIANGNAYAVQYGKTWMYDKLNDNWILKAGNPFRKLQYSVSAKCFTFNNTGYLLDSGTDLYKYDYVNNVWILVSQFPGIYGDISDKSFLVIGSQAYIAATYSYYQGGSPLMYSYHE